jgi:hypothetical protein
MEYSNVIVAIAMMIPAEMLTLLCGFRQAVDDGDVCVNCFYNPCCYATAPGTSSHALYIISTPWY